MKAVERPSWARRGQHLIDWEGFRVRIISVDGETGNALVQARAAEGEEGERWAMSASAVLRCFPVDSDGEPAEGSRLDGNRYTEADPDRMGAYAARAPIASAATTAASTANGAPAPVATPTWNRYAGV